MKKVLLRSIAVAIIMGAGAVKMAHAESPINTPSLSHTLSIGMSNSEVSTLQQMLQSLGYFTYPRITGRFGVMTQKAVIAFQKLMNSKADGIVGPVTRANLEKAIRNNHVSTTTNPITTETVWLPRKAGVTDSGGSAADTTAPTVSLLMPADNFPSSSKAVYFQAAAADNVGVVGVHYKVDGLSVGTEQTTAPYQLIWNDSSAAEGAHTVVAIARDAAGNTTTSSPVTYYIDTIAPTVTIMSPSGANYSTDPMTLSADVVEDQGSPTVVFNVYNAAPPNNQVFTQVVHSAPYTVNWSNGVSDGDYVVEAVATDTAGNVTSTTKTISITAAPSVYTLVTSLIGDGNGIVISTPAGINCGATCAAVFSSNTMVVLTAAPSVGSVFTGWSGECSGTGACVVSMTSNKNITATFSAI